jgi:cobalt/nickel transport system permease protein
MLRHDLESPILLEAAWMRRVQPGTRLIIALAGTFLIAALDQHGPLAAVALAATVLLLSRGVSWRWICKHLLGLASLLLFFALPLAWLGPGEATGPLGTRPGGIRLGLSIALKAGAILIWNWAWLLGIGSRLWRQGARQVHLPNQLAEVGWLMGASIGIVRKELRQMRLALRLRGGRISANQRGYHLLSNLLGMILWRSSGHADKISVAKGLRCEGPGETVAPLGFRQWAFALAVLAPLASLAGIATWHGQWKKGDWGYWL